MSWILSDELSNVNSVADEKAESNLCRACEKMWKSRGFFCRRFVWRICFRDFSSQSLQLQFRCSVSPSMETQLESYVPRFYCDPKSSKFFFCLSPACLFSCVLNYLSNKIRWIPNFPWIISNNKNRPGEKKNEPRVVTKLKRLRRFAEIFVTLGHESSFDLRRLPRARRRDSKAWKTWVWTVWNWNGMFLFLQPKLN